MRLKLAAIPGVVFVAVAAAMWGTDPIIRKTMSFTTSATTIVFGEHVILVLCTLPFLPPALRSVRRAGPRYLAAAVVVGAGASAVATILFTDALIGHSDFITPVVIQKIQPLIAIGAAAVILAQRPRPRFAWFLIPALIGFWLVSFPHPSQISANGLVVIGEATGAAILWALGTVLGRYLSREIEFQHVLSLRFFFGLLASAIALLVMNQPAYSNGHDALLILYLALVTGLLALGLYYFGLQHTPAMMASLAELTYPAVAVVAGIYAYDQHLRWSQWLGIAIILGTVTLLPMQRRRDVVSETQGDLRPGAGARVKLLLTSAGIKNPSIDAALVELLGKPIAECDALCVPTASYGHSSFAGARRFVAGENANTPMVQLGWKSVGLLEVAALSTMDRERWVAAVEAADVLLANGGDALFLAHHMRESGLAELLPTLDVVWAGFSAGSMVMAPRIGDDFKVWEPPGGGDTTLGLVDFAIFPHLDHPDLPENTMADAERWFAGLDCPAYAIDDDTAIVWVDGEVEVVSGTGHWKLLTA